MKQNFEFQIFMYLYEFLADRLQIVKIEINKLGQVKLG